jgi:hypothetical protein
MALYPGWWPGVAEVFGRPLDRVRITGNVICGGDEKVVYAADWSALGQPGDDSLAMDSLDVADLVSERAHDFTFPAPHGGWIVDAILTTPDGSRRWDAGRIVPEGKSIAWSLAPLPRSQAMLRMRTDRPARIRIGIAREGRTLDTREVAMVTRAPGQWIEVEVPLEATGGDRLDLTALTTFRLFHAWLSETPHRPR